MDFSRLSDELFTSDDTIDRVLGVPGQLLDNERPFRFLTTIRGRPVLLVCFNIANNQLGQFNRNYRTSDYTLHPHGSFTDIITQIELQTSYLTVSTSRSTKCTARLNVHVPIFQKCSQFTRHALTLLTHQTTLCNLESHKS